MEREASLQRKNKKMSVEVRLLSVACLCFIAAQWMVEEHPLDQGFRNLSFGFRIAALLAFIAGQMVGLRSRR
jgi:hypothetical protein